jgi:hypothetical protein
VTPAVTLTAFGMPVSLMPRQLPASKVEVGVPVLGFAATPYLEAPLDGLQRIVTVVPLRVSCSFAGRLGRVCVGAV